MRGGRGSLGPRQKGQARLPLGLTSSPLLFLDFQRAGNRQGRSPRGGGHLWLPHGCVSPCKMNRSQLCAQLNVGMSSSAPHLSVDTEHGAQAGGASDCATWQSLAEEGSPAGGHGLGRGLHSRNVRAVAALGPTLVTAGWIGSWKKVPGSTGAFWGPPDTATAFLHADVGAQGHNAPQVGPSLGVSVVPGALLPEPGACPPLGPGVAAASVRSKTSCFGHAHGSSVAPALPRDPSQLTQSMHDGRMVIKRHPGNSELFSGPFCSQRDFSLDSPLLGLALNQSPDPPVPGKREKPLSQRRSTRVVWVHGPLLAMSGPCGGHAADADQPTPEGPGVKTSSAAPHGAHLPPERQSKGERSCGEPQELGARTW